MKSKKIVAMIVAFAAFMAVATSGFAAVSTTTTYNQVADKVVVDVDVTEATPDSEVTYLVKSNDIIVYIDQKTADSNGAVGFDYKIAKDKIKNLTTSVQFGTNGAAAIAGTDTAIELNNLSVDAENATVALYSDANCQNAITGIVGDGDTVYAKVTVADGFELDTVKIGGVAQDPADVYTIVGNKAIEVTTKAVVVDPGVETPNDVVIEEVEDETVEVNGKPVEVKTVTKVLKVVGQPTEVGVVYNGEEYPALNLDGTSNYTTTDGLCAVRIIVGKDVVVDGLQAYYK